MGFAELSRTSDALTEEDLGWLRELEHVMPDRLLQPMRTTRKLGKLGLIELRRQSLTLTLEGRQVLLERLPHSGV